MYYHNLGHHHHAFEITISEFSVLSEHFVKNGFNVFWNLNEFTVDDRVNSDWGWSLLYDNGDGLYHFCSKNADKIAIDGEAEWLVDFFETRNMLNV